MAGYHRGRSLTKECCRHLEEKFLKLGKRVYLNKSFSGSTEYRSLSAEQLNSIVDAINKVKVVKN